MSEFKALSDVAARLSRGLDVQIDEHIVARIIELFNEGILSLELTQVQLLNTMSLIQGKIKHAPRLYQGVRVSYRGEEEIMFLRTEKESLQSRCDKLGKLAREMLDKAANIECGCATSVLAEFEVKLDNLVSGK